MTPRWDSPYASAVRDELIRMVEDSDANRAPAAAEADRSRSASNRVRFAIALVVALAVVVPATIVAFSIHHRSDVAGGSVQLVVATDRAYRYDPDHAYSVLSGTLHARRSGSSACFWLTTDRAELGRGPLYLVFPPGWSATSRLELLDTTRAVVAAPNATVTIEAPLDVFGRSRPIEGCHFSGTPVGVVRVLPATATSPTPAASVAAPTSTRGCAATAARTPNGALSATIADVDGDGRRDTEWALLRVGGTVRFGITTASGATVSGEQGFAGGGARSFVAGRLANGVVVAITSEGRDSPVFTFSRCAFHRLDGRSLISGTTARSQFTFYSEEMAGQAAASADGSPSSRERTRARSPATSSPGSSTSTRTDDPRRSRTSSA